MIGVLVLAVLLGFLGACWLAATLHAAWSSRAAARWPDPQATGASTIVGRPTPTPAGTARAVVSRHGQLVFVVPLGQGMLGLDCLLEATDESEPGLPVHLVITLPTSPWLAKVEQSLVTRWLTTGDPVDVELSLLPSLPQVMLTCDKTTLMLPLTVS